MTRHAGFARDFKTKTTSQLMKTSIRTLLAVLIVGLASTGCGPGTEVTEHNLRDAQVKWNRANVRDYNLEWIARGAAVSSHYYVFVRGGLVEEVRSVLPDGRELRVQPGDPSYFSIDGLFRTLEDDLARAQEERPFDQQAGTSVVMRFDPDPNLGYPKRYRRDVSGTRLGLALDVIRFETNPKLLGAIPPLPKPPITVKSNTVRPGG